MAYLLNRWRCRLFLWNLRGGIFQGGACMPDYHCGILILTTMKAFSLKGSMGYQAKLAE